MKALKQKSYVLGFEMQEAKPLEFDIIYILTLKEWLKSKHNILIEINYNHTADCTDGLFFYPVVITDYNNIDLIYTNFLTSDVVIFKNEYKALKAGCELAIDIINSKL